MKVAVDIVRRNSMLRPTGRGSPHRTVLFNNLRELWQGQRAAARLNMTFNAYVRSLIADHSTKVLNGEAGGNGNSNGKRKGSR
jgi:hypothetical protein